jgi:hypothetical protein
MKRKPEEEEEEARQQRVLDQIKRHQGRGIPVPVGRFHEDSEPVRKKRIRKNEKRRLRDLACSHNKGMGDE